MPYHKLKVVQQSYDLALRVHKLTLNFPKIEQYALAQQLRSSSKSISVNIVEGMGKQESQKEVSRYLRIALGSCDETRMWVQFAKDLEYLSHDDFQLLSDQYCEVGKMIRGLLKRYSHL